MNGFFCLGGTTMKSSVIKRSIVIGGHKTSVSLEDAFWNGLREIANIRNETLSSLVGSIDVGRQNAHLSSATRRFVLGFYRNRLGPEESLATSLTLSPLSSATLGSRMGGNVVCTKPSSEPSTRPVHLGTDATS